MSERTAVVVGAGIIGLATAAVLLREGWRVTLVDRDGPGEATSRGNAGGIAHTDLAPMASPKIMRDVPRWLFDPLGPLAIRPTYAHRLLPWLIRFLRNCAPDRFRAGVEAMTAIQMQSLPAWERLWDEAGMLDHVNRHGILELYDDAARFAGAAGQYEQQRAAGVEVHLLDGHEIRQMEPAVGPAAVKAAFVPGWYHVNDPYAHSLALADHVRGRGGVFRRAAVAGVEVDGTVVLEGGERLTAGRTVIAAGAWSAKLTRDLGDPIPLETERGYNVTARDSGISLKRMLYFCGHGFVATPMSIGLRVGGAVELGGLDLPPNWKRVDAMATRAARFLPGVDLSQGERWMGHRPTVPDCLPVIGRSGANDNILYAFAHAHHGLTQAAATAEAVAALATGRAPAFDLHPFRPERF